jgi:ribonucleoside-diphosphate reductase alpha chain
VLTRNRTDKLSVVPSGGREAGGTYPSAEVAGSAGEASRGGDASSRVTAFAGRTEVSGSTVLKTEPEQKLSPTEQLEAREHEAQLPLPRSDQRTETKATAAARRAEAKARGYEGEMCTECLNFTLVRNGTCLKCDTCGSTTGCS